MLYHLPLPNIYDNGSICMGSVDMEIKREINGKANAHFLSFTKSAPLKSAIAICGANPQGRFGIIRYRALINTIRLSEIISDLLIFI